MHHTNNRDSTVILALSSLSFSLTSRQVLYIISGDETHIVIHIIQVGFVHVFLFVVVVSLQCLQSLVQNLPVNNSTHSYLLPRHTIEHVAVLRCAAKTGIPLLVLLVAHLPF